MFLRQHVDGNISQMPIDNASGGPYQVYKRAYIDHPIQLKSQRERKEARAGLRLRAEAGFQSIPAEEVRADFAVYR